MEDRTEEELCCSRRIRDAAAIEAQRDGRDLRLEQPFAVLASEFDVGLDRCRDRPEQRFAGRRGQLADRLLHEDEQIGTQIPAVGHDDHPVDRLTPREEGVEHDRRRRWPGPVERLLPRACARGDALHREFPEPDLGDETEHRFVHPCSGASTCHGIDSSQNETVRLVPSRVERMSHHQVWMITGAARGLGRALTLAALAEGHSVVATVRGEHTLPEHAHLRTLVLDVRDRSAARATVDAAVAEFGRVDVLVNNAGYGMIGAVEEVGEAEARHVIDTDLLGPLWLSQAVIPVMRRQAAGHIVQVSTVGAVGSMPTLGLYNAAKWGLEGWTEAMSAEVATFGIRTSIVEPGAIDTGWATGSMRFATPDAVYDDLRTSLFGTAEVPWPSAGTGGGSSPESVAAAVLAHVADPDDRRLRVLVGEDAPGQVRAALDRRIEDYRLDPRWGAD